MSISASRKSYITEMTKLATVMKGWANDSPIKNIVLNHSHDSKSAFSGTKQNLEVKKTN